MNGRVVACVCLDKEGCVRMRSNRASVTKRLHENVVSGRKSVDVFKLSIFPKKHRLREGRYVLSTHISKRPFIRYGGVLCLVDELRCIRTCRWMCRPTWCKNCLRQPLAYIHIYVYIGFNILTIKAAVTDSSKNINSFTHV